MGKTWWIMRDFSASDPTVISYWSCDLHALVKQLKTNIFSKMLTTTFIKFNVIFIDLTISVIKVNNNFIHQHLASIRNLVCLTWDKTVVEPKHWRVIACFLPLEDAAYIVYKYNILCRCIRRKYTPMRAYYLLFIFMIFF